MDNPWQSPTYYVNDKYYSIKHYSYFIEKGDTRIGTDPVTSTDNSIRISAFLTADKKKVRIMVINTSGSTEQKLAISVPGFESAALNEYQSTDLAKFKTISSPKPGNVSIPARSLTTLELVLP
jgi:alpha-L-arabinofuranosidase